jgi:hypothetical protein
MMKHLKWIFNPLMIWGAILGFVIFGALGQIQDAWHHTGAGYINYEEPDRTEKTTEFDYKRHKYATAAMMLSVGLFLWIVVAKGSRANSHRDRPHRSGA